VAEERHNKKITAPHCLLSFEREELEQP